MTVFKPNNNSHYHHAMVGLVETGETRSRPETQNIAMNFLGDAVPIAIG